jgi:hypothetical protein
MRKLVWLIAVAALYSGEARATVPKSFSVQGVLRDSSGKLQSMMVNVTVNLWDAQMMGNQLAGPYQQTVMAQNGLFTIAITDNAILTKLANPPPPPGGVWLELIVGNDTFPRQLVTPSMYSLMSAQADTALSVSCTGCITNATIADGTVDVAKLAQPAGGKATPINTAAYYINDNVIHAITSVSINAPGPGVVLVASSGWIQFYTHSNGTQDVLDCCLDTGLACSGSSPTIQEYQVPAAWPTVPGGTGNYNMSWPLSLITTLPVSAKGAVSVNLNCTRLSGDGNGLNIKNARLQAFYMPGQY